MRYARLGRNGLIGLVALVLIAGVLPIPGHAQVVSVLNYFSTATGRDNVLNINGTLNFEGKATVLDHGTATLNAAGHVLVTTNLSSVVTCTLALNTTTTGDDPVMVTGLWTTGGATLEIQAWKNTGGTDPTLLQSTTNAIKVGYLCAGAD